ncbi:hypothetical protein [Actinomadura sp. WMMA1423]|uniref:hypothetical protein n=1 Tax=Actinomadura sp. WMMA1423 TaxID=2591108 RepID=UPI001146757F|nr:hypothetical protein [Actinomadura sp. WMMA1423]
MTASAVTAVLAFAAPAHATGVSVYAGRDYTEVADGRRTAYICDQERDGVDVYGKVMGVDARGYMTYYLDDPNGAAAGCGSVNTDRPIVYIEVCQDDWGGDTCRGTWL